MKRILAMALLLCSTAHAQQFFNVASQPAVPDAVNDGQQKLANIPWASDEDIKRSAFGVSSDRDGIAPEGEHPTVRNRTIQNYWGAGILTKAGEGRIESCISRHNYIGAKLGTSDNTISNCLLYNNRDVGLWIAAGSGSANCQSNCNHCYGARIACYNEGSQSYRAINDTYADAFIGFLGDIKVAGSNQCALTNILFQHNTIRDCVFKATNCHLVNCFVNVQREVKRRNTVDIPGVANYSGKVGVELGQRCSIRGGTVALFNWKHPLQEFSGKPAEAVWVNGDDCVIDTMLVDDDGIDGSIGIRTKGARRSLKVDCMVRGFHQPNERILVVDNAARTNGLDITIRINGAVKPIGGYIDIGAGWTGSFRLIDTSSGKTMALPEGTATK